ncbi:ATP-binding protein [Serratia sp. CY76391]|uniref:ATP-binding protein n=1 Tax=Serratia sp. CY76391 TaxID=3383681 RepID=UPI003F9ED4A0
MNAPELRELAVEALKGKTLAQHRVYSPRDWSTRDGDYPVLLVQTVYEEKHSLGRNAPQFNTVTTLQIAARIEEFDGELDDDGAMKAQFKLEQIKEEIERAVINSYEITRLTQQFKHIRSQLDLNPEGEGHTGQLIIQMDIEYYQGPEDFYPIEAEPLKGVDVRLDMPDGTVKPGIDIELPQPFPDGASGPPADD